MEHYIIFYKDLNQCIRCYPFGANNDEEAKQRYAEFKKDLKSCKQSLGAELEALRLENSKGEVIPD